MNLSKWYKQNFSQEDLIKMYVSIENSLGEIRKLRAESSQENRLLDERDAIWYALDERSKDEIDLGPWSHLEKKYVG